MLLHISGMSLASDGVKEFSFSFSYRVGFWQWRALHYEDLELNSTWKRCKAYSVDIPNLTKIYNHSMTSVRSKGTCIL